MKVMCTKGHVVGWRDGVCVHSFEESVCVFVCLDAITTHQNNCGFLFITERQSLQTLCAAIRSRNCKSWKICFHISGGVIETASGVIRCVACIRFVGVKWKQWRQTNRDETKTRTPAQTHTRACVCEMADDHEFVCYITEDLIRKTTKTENLKDITALHFRKDDKYKIRVRSLPSQAKL